MIAWLALIRGINVGGHNKVPMAELKDVCRDLSFESVSTYIQSGNVVFRSTGNAVALETALEQALHDAFGVTAAVIVRDSSQWSAMMEANPFSEESAASPNRVMAVVPKVIPVWMRSDSAAPSIEELLGKATQGERVAAVQGGLWVSYPEGQGTSKLTPQVLERFAGSPVTLRNWRTVCKLREMLAETGVAGT